MRRWLTIALVCVSALASERDDQARCRNNFFQTSSEIEAPISEEDAMMFQRIVTNCLEDDTNNEIGFGLRALSEYDWTKKYVKSPGYVSKLKVILSDATVKYRVHQEELPENRYVEKAYDRFLSYQKLLKEAGSFYQKSLYCQAASDAAVYFLYLKVFGLVQKYDDALDKFNCGEEYHSWHQAKKKGPEGP